MAGDLEPSRHLTRCRHLSGDHHDGDGDAWAPGEPARNSTLTLTPS